MRYKKANHIYMKLKNQNANNCGLDNAVKNHQESIELWVE